MIDSKWRKPYQNFVIEPVLKLPIAKLSPILLTACACLFGLMTLGCLTLHLSIPAFGCLVLSGFCDTLDGSLARHQNSASPKGAALDITSDRFVEFAIILGLYFFNPQLRALGALLMLGTSFLCVTTFLVVGIFEKNATEKSFHYSLGLIERAEAFIFFGMMILMPTYFGVLSLLYSGLVFLTAVTRLYQFCRIL